MEIVSDQVQRGAKNGSTPDYTRGDCRVFGIPVVDSLLPDGVPVPCSLLIAADPGSGSEVISTAIMQEHLSTGQRALWLSLENLVDDLRGDIHYLWIANQPQVQFIDCYSSQIGIDSKERYNCDPSNLPYLSMVTAAAMSEMNDGGRLLIILDSLTSLIQKVGVRRSTEFLRTLIGKSRSISADLLTTLNRAAFSEATLATFVDLADIVLELAIQDSETSAGNVRVRKARNVRHHKSWRAYAIDLEHRTLRCDLLPSLELDQVAKTKNGNGHRFEGRDVEKDLYPFDLATEDEPDSHLKPGSNVRCEGPFCTLGGRALMERERLAIMAEVVGTLGMEYQTSLRALESFAKRSSADNQFTPDLLKELSERIQNMERLFKVVHAQNHIRPNFRLSKVSEVIQRALADSIVPSSIEVVRESKSSADIFADPAMTVRALSGVIEAAVQEMPYGGFLSITNSEEQDASVIVVKDNGMGKWKDDLSGIFNPEDQSSPVAGLGLVVSRRFIESMKGQLRIESEKGKGSSFTIRLPKKSAGVSSPDSIAS
jgi:archaellum biogenesis ATPase FlaH/two-component sensor histidine kinase